MTYIAAFYCQDGIVMCADTQETHQAGSKDEKEYVEKLYAPENLSFPVAVGGAGLDEPIEAFSLELFDRIDKSKPTTVSEFRSHIQLAINEVHDNDAKISAWPKMYRTTKCIVAGKPTHDEFAIFVITGKRVSYRKTEPVIIGYDTPANSAMLKRMYRPYLSMQQAVMLAVYLLTQSKARDVGVGGDSRVVVVRDNGAWIDDVEYIKNAEVRVSNFMKLIDNLLLFSIDVGIRPSLFAERSQQFISQLKQFRQQYLIWSAERSLNRQMFDKTWRGEPYSKVFPGAITQVDEHGHITVREETPEEISEQVRIAQLASMKLNRNLEANQRFSKMNEGRMPVYLGAESVVWKPSRSAADAGETKVLTTPKISTTGQQS